MNAIWQVLLALLAVVGLLALGWLLFGKLVTPVGGGGGGPVYAVVPAAGDGEHLEQDVKGLLWLRGGELAEDHSHSGFWSGLLLVMLFSLTLGWLPSQGMGTGFVPMLRSLVLPSLTLGINSAAMVARMTRSSMLEVIRQDYITTARAKGAKERNVIYRHALRNALNPIITVIGGIVAGVLGGTMVTEQIFGIPGIGSWLLTAVSARDYPVIRGSVLVISLMFCLCMLVVDILYVVVNPRMANELK